MNDPHKIFHGWSWFPADMVDPPHLDIDGNIAERESK